MNIGPELNILPHVDKLGQPLAITPLRPAVKAAVQRLVQQEVHGEKLDDPMIVMQSLVDEDGNVPVTDVDWICRFVAVELPAAANIPGARLLAEKYGLVIEL